MERVQCPCPFNHNKVDTYEVEGDEWTCKTGYYLSGKTCKKCNKKFNATRSVPFQGAYICKGAFPEDSQKRDKGPHDCGHIFHTGCFFEASSNLVRTRKGGERETMDGGNKRRRVVGV